MSARRHEPWRARFEDFKEAYVLRALSDDERQEFEGYLAEHPETQAEVDDLGAIAGLLALAPHEYEPSPKLRRNLLSSIEGLGETLPAEAPPRRAGSRHRSGLFGSGGLAAAVAAAAVLAVVGLFLWNTSLRDENEDLLADNEDLSSELETRQTYALQGPGPAESVRGEVIKVREDRAVLVADNLPPAPEGQVYEAWLMRGGVPEPAGLFRPRDGGETAAPIEGSLDGAEAVAVTVEPSSGSPMPTSDILLSTEL